MKLTPSVSILFIIACGIGSVLFFCSCESDPILTPQAEVAEEGGSYGNTNLPVGSTEKTAEDAQKREIGTTNPKRF